MKRGFLAIGILSMLLFTGCTASQSEIGGTDGPAKIEVSAKEEAKSVDMIRVDGNLYCDTGKISENVARCGTMDGELKKTADEFEIPQTDGSCNFKEAKGYQNATALTKELPTAGGWRIFKKIDDPEKELTQYRYCYTLRGTMPNVSTESEWIVFSNDKNLDFDRVAKSLYSSNSKDSLDIYTVPLLPEDTWGIRMTAVNVAATGLTLRLEQFGGSPTGELQTGERFSLEQNIDGQWEVVATKFLDFAWNDIAYSIPKNDVTELQVDWEWLYGEIPSGSYRISKQIDDVRAAGNFDSKDYYAEFVVD